jgi:glycosyltransferase involved in cell wall biosynthesis
MSVVVEPKAHPSVSAIIPAYNAEAYLQQAIESVLAQTLPVLECIVVDDGSADRTAEVAAAYGPSVRLVRQANRGVSAARNRGMAESNGDLLAFLDADDRWLPDRLRLQLAALLSDPAAEAVVCATRVVDESLAPIGEIRQDPELTAEELLLCRASVVSASSNLLIRREAFEAIGGFDEDLSTSADWALMFRLLERGRLVALPDALVEYRRHETNMSADVERFEQDMLAAYGRVFQDPAPPLRRLRRRAYANLHRMIAGSYFVDRRLGRFIRNAARSIGEHPSTLPYFLALPVRRLRRRMGGGAGTLTSPRA